MKKVCNDCYEDISKCNECGSIFDYDDDIVCDEGEHICEDCVSQTKVILECDCGSHPYCCIKCGSILGDDLICKKSNDRFTHFCSIDCKHRMEGQTKL